MNDFLLVNMKIQPSRVVGSSNTTHSISFFQHSFFKLIFSALLIISALCSRAQSTPTEQQKADYKKAIAERSTKIVNTLSITDSVKYKKVVSIISDQYFSLNNLQEQNALAVADVKKQSPDKDKQAEAVKNLDEKKICHPRAASQ